MFGQNGSNAKAKRCKDQDERPKKDEENTLLIYMRTKRIVIIHGGSKLLEFGDIDETVNGQGGLKGVCSVWVSIGLVEGYAWMRINDE